MHIDTVSHTADFKKPRPTKPPPGSIQRATVKNKSAKSPSTLDIYRISPNNPLFSIRKLWLTIAIADCAVQDAALPRVIEASSKIFFGSNSNNLKKYQEIKETRTNTIEDCMAVMEKYPLGSILKRLTSN